MSLTPMVRIGLLMVLASFAGLAACSSLLGVDSGGATLSGDGSNCQAKTCKDFGVNACGKHDDSCGKILDCGACCVPKTCAEVGAQCGPIDNGCGGLVQCGACTVAKTQCVQNTQTSDAGSLADAKPADSSADGSPAGSPSADTSGPSASYCACVPDSTCAGVECGEVADGCGRRYVCNNAPCPVDKPNCTAGKCTATVCVAKTCAGLAKNCDDIQDGCGKILNCGTCSGAAQCGGSGVANVCGCTPKTCAQFGKNCDSVADGCGGTVVCSTGCTLPNSCGGGGTPNVCGCTPKSMEVACGARICGNVDDGCGTPISCGLCDGICKGQGTICYGAALQPQQPLP